MGFRKGKAAQVIKGLYDIRMVRYQFGKLGSDDFFFRFSRPQLVEDIQKVHFHVPFLNARGG